MESFPPSYESIKRFADEHTIGEINDALERIEYEKWMYVHAFNIKMKEYRGEPHYSEPYEGMDFDH